MNQLAKLSLSIFFALMTCGCGGHGHSSSGIIPTSEPLRQEVKPEELVPGFDSGARVRSVKKEVNGTFLTGDEFFHVQVTCSDHSSH